MSYVPKYILKRIVPKDAIANLDMNGDGKADAVGAKYVNVISPLEISPDTKKEDLLAQFIGVNIDDNIITDFNKVKLWYNGEVFSFKDIDKLIGKTLPIGSFLVIIMDIPGGIPAGMHRFGIKTQYKGQVSHNEVEREVSADVKKLEALTKVV